MLVINKEDDNNIALVKFNQEGIEYYRKLVNSNSLRGKEFYKVLNKYEELVRDSVIFFSKKEDTNLNLSLKENYYTTTIRYCSISGRIGTKGNGLLLQTGSNSNGKVTSSFETNFTFE